MQLRSEGWSKHTGNKNGRPFWAVIGEPRLSTWTQPSTGDLAVRKAKMAKLDKVTCRAAALGICGEADTKRMWTQIMKGAKTINECVVAWDVKVREAEAKRDTRQSSVVIEEGGSGGREQRGIRADQPCESPLLLRCGRDVFNRWPHHLPRHPAHRAIARCSVARAGLLRRSCGARGGRKLSE